MSALRYAFALAVAVSLTTFVSDGFAVSLPTAGQVLHLDASYADSFTLSGANVETWADLSSSGNNASQFSTTFQPTRVSGAMNGLPVVRFDGADDYLGLLSTMNLTGGMELFIVAQNLTDGDLFSNGWQFSGPAAGFRFLSNNTSNLTAQIGQAGSMSTPITTPYSVMVGLTYNDSVDNYDLRQTGELAASILAGANYSLNSPHGARIGASNNNPGDVIRFLDGDIAEVLIYNQPLSESDRQLVEGLLAYKWGLQGQLPVDHPYFNLDPNFVPEPSTFWLLGTFLGMVSLRRRKQASA